MVTLRHKIFSESYTFSAGGASEQWDIDFREYFGVPARSWIVTNNGAGSLTVKASEDGARFDGTMSLANGDFLGTEVQDNVVTTRMMITASAAGTSVNVVAAPGLWTDDELIAFDSGMW